MQYRHGGGWRGKKVWHWKCQNTQDSSESNAFVFLCLCQESCDILAVKYNFIN